MIRDGIDKILVPRKLRAQGWMPISTAPLANWNWSKSDHSLPKSEPHFIEGLTTLDNVVIARYEARGDYEDRWTNPQGNLCYNLTHWRPLGSS